MSEIAAEPTVEGGRLHIWDAYWDFRVAECPCDADFIAWLDENAITDSAIFHFGTGGHHHVGIACAEPGRRNSVLGITASPQEHASFVELAIARPETLRWYNAVFGDIYLVNPRLLPVFDVVTLFHLCEFRGEKNDAYGAMTDAEVVDVLAARTRPGGHMLFFPGSYAWDRADHSAKDVVADWAVRSGAVETGRFRSLLVYRMPV